MVRLWFRFPMNNQTFYVQRSDKIYFLRLDADEPSHAKKLVIVNNKGGLSISTCFIFYLPLADAKSAVHIHLTTTKVIRLREINTWRERM